MARVLTRVARKDYPGEGIVKGDTYSKVSLKTGPRSSRTLRSKTPFKRHQLTSSDYLQRVYVIADETVPAISCPDDVQSLKDEIEEIKSELEEKLENMPEGLKEGPTGQMLQERMDECDDFLNSLEGLEFMEEHEWEETEREDEDEIAGGYAGHVAAIVEEIQGFCPF